MMTLTRSLRAAGAIVCLAAGIGAAPAARAGLIIEADSGPIRVAAPVVSAPPLAHVGSLPSNVGRITRDMTNQPLGQVLASLVPKGWSGYTKDARLKDMGQVSYRGLNRPWPIVLEELLAAHDLRATIDWNKRELSVSWVERQR